MIRTALLGAIAWSGNPAGFTSSSKYYFMGQRTRTPRGVISITGNNTCLTRIYLGKTTGAHHSFRLAFPGHYNTTGGTYPTEVVSPASITIDGVSIIYSADGSNMDPTQGTFVNGNWTGTVAPGMSGIVSGDIATPTDLAGIGGAIPVGRHVWAQWAYTTSTSVTIPLVYAFLSTGNLEGTLRSTTTFSATDSRSLTGASTQSAYGPAFVVCKGHAGRAVFLAWGDSILSDLYEQTSAYTSGVSGFANRAAAQATKPVYIANHGVPGAGPHQWTHSGRAYTNGAKIDLIGLVTTLNSGTPPFTHILSEHGTNSVNGLAANTTGTGGTPNAGTTGGTADATTGVAWNTPGGFISGMKVYADLLRSEFGAEMEIHQTGIIAKGGTSDGWQTLVNQTPNAATVAQGFGFNTQMASDLCAGKFTSYIDTPSAVGDASDKTRWKVQSFATTLAATYTASATTCTLTSVSGLSVGDALLKVPAGSNGLTAAFVSAINVGTGVATIGDVFAAGGTIGDVVVTTPSRDGTHPSSTMHKLMAVPVAAKFDAINAAVS